MSEDARVAQMSGHLAQVHRFYDELINQRQLAVAEEIIAADCSLEPQPDGLTKLSGPAGIRSIVSTYLIGFSDLTITVDEEVIEGDAIAVSWTTSGIHQGTFWGIERTGMPVRFTGKDVFSFADGLISRIWSEQDSETLLRQIVAGLTPRRRPSGLGQPLNLLSPIVLIGVVVAIIVSLRFRSVYDEASGSQHSDLLCRRALERRDEAERLLLATADAVGGTSTTWQRRQQARDQAASTDADVKRYCRS